MVFDRIFHLSEHQTNLQREVIAGITTFVTMAYIVVVNPAILEVTGMPRDASMTATALTAALGTLLMAFYANRPFAIAPYMGENAFIAYTVCLGMGLRWQSALGAILISGILFVILTITKARSNLADAIPPSLRFSFACGIGLFLAFIGLVGMGIVRLGTEGAPVHVGSVTEPRVLVSVATLVIMGILSVRRVTGAILISIALGTVIAFLAGVQALPSTLFSSPPSLAPIFLSLDLGKAVSPDFINITLVILVMAFLDTIATLLAVSSQANFLDKDGNLPQIEKPMLCDAIATTCAAIIGTTTAGAYIESASGVRSGGRTGLTALVVAILFLLTLFFAPILTSVPACAYAPALVVVGASMMTTITRIPFDRTEEAFPAFVVIALMSFTYNIAIGMTAGFLLYPLFMVASGRGREVKPGMWVFFVISLILFAVYPS
jgi:AGZA family xanthine/uracil permease-like MFS transporter